MPPAFCEQSSARHQLHHPVLGAGAIEDDAQDKTKALILNLPDEILSDILQRVYASKPSRPHILRVAHTCKRFYRNLLPILYESIEMEGNRRLPGLLSRTLHENAALGYFCKQLQLVPAMYMAPELAAMEQIIPFLVNVNSLEINAGGHPLGISEENLSYGHLLQYSVQWMPVLEQVSLIGTKNDPWNIRQVMSALRSRSLKKLDIFNVSKSTPNHAPRNTERPGSCQVSNLELSEWREPAEAMARLLEWCEQLSSFKLRRCLSRRDLNLPRFIPMLMKHRDTLVSLNIDLLHLRGRGAVFDLSDFTALKWLRLSRYQMDAGLQNAQRDASRLVAPNLRHFCWFFNYDFTDWASFGEQDEQWVRAFAQVAASRKTPDCTIEIEYHSKKPRRKSEGCPWDRLQRVQDEIRNKAVVLTQTSRMTKLQWQAWAGSFQGDHVPGWGMQLDQWDDYWAAF